MLPCYNDELMEETEHRDSTMGCLIEDTLLQTMGSAMDQSMATSEKTANRAFLLKAAGERGAGQENDKT